MSDFKLTAPFSLSGDQGSAVATLSAGVNSGQRSQVLLGVTGSGKTFTIANVIAKTKRPALVLAHNKTLAGQLYQELRDFFPCNAVSYFVSYYDYYQPEAYIASTDTYIEKEATINDEIDRLRLSATTNLLTRRDCIVVASVSCIYNLGSPASYAQSFLEIIAGEVIARESLLLRLQAMQYQHSPYQLKRATYRLKGDVLQVWSASDDLALSIDTLEDKIVSIHRFNPVSGELLEKLTTSVIINPAKHHLVDRHQHQALRQIEVDLQKRLKELEQAGKIIEAYRLKQKVTYDLEQIKNFGFVSGIENYSRYFDGRASGDPPFTLLDYFWENQKIFSHQGFLTFVDESHMSIPQVRGMYFGDRSRKENLIKYGFRLPSALDNRPLRFNEFLSKNQQFIFVSATPAEWEIKQAGGKVVQQLLRPTGILDPQIQVRPSEGQIEDLVKLVLERKKRSQRTLITVLTKKLAETLTDYLNDKAKLVALTKNPHIPLPQVAYLHSDIETLERSDILADLRSGKYDVVVGINLLREGLDLPEVSLVIIVDADKEGFLRSTASLIQTIGRAGRHVDGMVVMYADTITASMQEAMDETNRRRKFQQAYNQAHHLTPTSVKKPIRERLLDELVEHKNASVVKTGTLSPHSRQRPPLIVNLDKKTALDLNNFHPQDYTPYERQVLAGKLRRAMSKAAKEMDFELAAVLRDSARSLTNS